VFAIQTVLSGRLCSLLRLLLSRVVDASSVMDEDRSVPVSGGTRDDYQLSSARSKGLGWDQQADSHHEEPIPHSSRRHNASSAYEDISDRMSRTSDLSHISEFEGSASRSETRLVFDAESGQYVRKIQVANESEENKTGGVAQSFLRRFTGTTDSYELPGGQTSAKASSSKPYRGNGGSVASSSEAEEVKLIHGRKGGSQQDEDFLRDASKRLFNIGSRPPTVEQKLHQKVSPFYERLKRFYRNYMFESIWLIMILIGVLMSILAWCIDELTEYLFELRNNIGKLPTLNSNRRREGLEKWLYEQDWTAAFFLWWAWSVFFGFVSILTVRYLAPQAGGSGIEQVRSIMTGYSIPGYLDLNTLVAKVIGLVTVQASGLTLGKEGPFVHIACSLANILLNLSLFSELKKSRALTKQVISAACATGIASTFGAPVGGVLFAVEVTSNVYHTADYWKAFFTAVCGEVVFRELSYFGTARASQISLFPTTFPAQPYLLAELPAYIILATICGLYGGIYVKIILGIRSWRTQLLAKATQHVKQQRRGNQVLPTAAEGDEEQAIAEGLREREDGCGKQGWGKVGVICYEVYMRMAYVLLQQNMYAFCVISGTAIINWFTGQFMKRTLYAGIADFLVSGEMAQDDVLNVSADHRLHSTDWGSPSLLFNLIMYFVIKSCLCAIALSLPVPTGTLIPMLAIGLSMGRIGGEIVQMLFGPTFIPGGYALVGASAFIAGATGAISTAVIIFEITAQLSYMVPVLVAVIIGRQAGRLISPDFYEALQIMKKLPNIPPLTHQSSYNILAMEIMNPNNIPIVQRFSSMQDIESALSAPTFRHDGEVHDDDLFAVVDDDGNYLASVARHQLQTVLSTAGASTGLENADVFDMLTIVDTNAIAPSVPITATAIDCLQMFELTLCNAMFVTDKCRVVGWLDLNTIRHKCESGEL